jgi:hypothetical protein
MNEGITLPDGKKVSLFARIKQKHLFNQTFLLTNKTGVNFLGVYLNHKEIFFYNGSMLAEVSFQSVRSQSFGQLQPELFYSDLEEIDPSYITIVQPTDTDNSWLSMKIHFLEKYDLTSGVGL